MRRQTLATIIAIALGVAACASGGGSSAQDQEQLMAADRNWSAAAGNSDTFMSFLTADAAIYPPGAPRTTGSDAIRAMFDGMRSSPGFAVHWTPNRADVAGTIGHTVGTYEMTMNGVTEHGKYVTLWRKGSDGWKVTDDMFSPDAPPPGAAMALVMAGDVKWGDAPASLPAGAKLAVISGDPTKAGPFVVRLQFPAGYKIPAHWHPTDEHVTVLSGTMGVGMGDAFDAAALKTLTAGGYVVLPAKMNHFATAKTAATIEIHSDGPFVVNYVNPADDPTKK